jgi:hypothetical protein
MTVFRRFAYRTKPDRGDGIPMPLVPIALSNGPIAVEALGLVDSGSTVNVLPYELGTRLGFMWDDEDSTVELTGSLSQFPAKVVVARGEVADLGMVNLAFAWTLSNEAPLILLEMLRSESL